MSNNILFRHFDLRSAIEAREREMYNKIDSYDADRLLNTSADDLAQYFAETHEMPNVVLKDDEIHADQSESRVDVSRDFNRAIFDRSQPLYVTGTLVTLIVPFDGEADLFDAKASTFSANPPYGTVSGQTLRLSTARTDHNAEAVKRELQQELGKVRQHLLWINNDLLPFNNSLLSKAKTRIEQRRNKLLKDRELVAALGFPLRPRGESGTFAPPEIKRKAPPKPPPATSAPYKPEPALPERDYNHVLEIIEQTATMLERSPATFSGMGEEQLRDQFLVPLNSHYQGQATGETFNSSGKTDILVRVNDRPVFIAECKMWRGRKKLAGAIDQVLSYSTWRDTKAAIVVFNRNKNLSEVLQAVPDVLTGHPNLKRILPYSSETGCRAVFAHPSDANREVILTVLVFDVPRSA